MTAAVPKITSKYIYKPAIVYKRVITVDHSSSFILFQIIAAVSKIDNNSIYDNKRGSRHSK